MGSKFDGKVVLVTGAAAGIGRATAMAFGAQNARVLVADLDARRAEETAEAIRKAGSDAAAVKVDVAVDSDVKSMIDVCVKKFGGLDVAVNNAGIEGKAAMTHDCTEENWDRTLAVNLRGTWLCMRHQIPRMLERGSGSIINMASIAGLIGFRQMPAYTASKHGIIGLTKVAALELADRNIRVNVVCPGVIHTEMVDRVTAGSAEGLKNLEKQEPMGRLGTSEEIARAVLFLASDDSSFVTGQSLAVDGGWMAG